MIKKKVIEKLYDKLEHLERVNRKLDEDISDLYKRLLKQEELSEKKDRKAILKDYDIAILVKDNKTYILKKGEEEKRVRSYTLRQDVGSYPILEIEELLY